MHVLPQEMLGISTFGISTSLLKWFPVQVVDRFLLRMSRLVLGDTDRLGLVRPKMGPLERKIKCGKTPVLDVGTLAKIRSGHIKVYKLCLFFFFSLTKSCLKPYCIIRIETYRFTSTDY